MKNKSYANRGQAFEEFIKYANSRYKQAKVAVIDKMPTEFIPIRNDHGKIVNVKVEEKSKVDFIGRVFNVPIAIEAKETMDDSIRFDRVEPHQAEYMDEFTEQPGTIGLVLVSFGTTRFYAIPWRFWQAAYNARVRPGATRETPVTVEAFGQTWEVPRKYSVRQEELNPAWEVTTHETFGLHYLINTRSYITPRK